MKSNNTADFSGIMDVVILWSNVVLGVIMGLAVVFAIWKLIIILISIMRNADNPEARGNDLSALKWPIIAIILISIMRNADNPEARGNDLSALKWPIIAIIIILVVIAVMNVILQVIKTYNPSIGT